MRRRGGACLVARLVALFVVLLPGLARADATSAFAQWQYSAGVLLDQYSEGAPAKWSYALGAGTEVVPRYDGAARHDTNFFPLADVRYRDLAFASVSEGIGVNLLRRHDARAGLALNWDFGRAARDARGIDRLPSGPVADLFGEQLVRSVVLRADLRHSPIHGTGLEAEFGAYAPLPFGKSFYLFLGPSLSFVDGPSARRQFAVSTGDAARSGYRAFDTHAGLKAVNFGGNAVWLIDEHWLVEVLGAYARLFGSAAHSPLTGARENFSAGLALVYAF